jgi:hypothetical protein
MSIKPLCLIFCIFLPAIIIAQEYLFKQPRDAKVEINTKSLPWLLKVDFLSINCFDAEKNLLLNQSKADFYVKLALMQKLGLESGETLQIEEKKRISENLVRNRFHAKFEIPNPPLVVKSGSSSNDSSSSGGVSKDNVRLILGKSDLLARKKDVFDTIETLGKISQTQFPIAPKKGSSNAETEMFLNSIADFEDKSLRDYESLENEIEADKLLLSSERKELLEKLNSEKSKLLNELATHAQKVVDES